MPARHFRGSALRASGSSSSQQASSDTSSVGGDENDDVDELDYETFEEATLMNVNLDDGDDPSSGLDDAQSALKKKKKSNAPKVGITVDPRPESERGAWYISQVSKRPISL